MILAAIYAGQKDPSNQKIAQYNMVLEAGYPKEVKSIEILSGMNLVEQKLQSALNNIYDGKYDRTLTECNEILELEPRNITAYKRAGSAYYALKKIDKAKEMWNKALEISPNDTELKKFIKITQ
jgi:tetratricopeptide (TPR) repeat protein